MHCTVLNISKVIIRKCIYIVGEIFILFWGIICIFGEFYGIFSVLFFLIYGLFRGFLGWQPCGGHKNPLDGHGPRLSKLKGSLL
jgi:hypothetical protein